MRVAALTGLLQSRGGQVKADEILTGIHQKFNNQQQALKDAMSAGTLEVNPGLITGFLESPYS